MKNYVLKMMVLITSIAVVIAPTLTMVSAQETIKIGILQSMEHSSLNENVLGIIDGLEEAGYVDGENIEITLQNANGQTSDMQTISEQLVRDNDYIFAIATPAVQALANITQEIPIFFTSVADPLGAGVVDSFEEPGANITGTTNIGPIAEQIELMLATYPDAKTVGVLYNAGEVNAQYQVSTFEEILSEKGLELIPQTIASTNDIASAMNNLLEEVDVIILPTDNTVASSMGLVGEMAKEQNIGIFGGSNDMIEENGLASYGLDYYELGKQTARMMIRAHEEGLAPNEMPVEKAEVLELIVNEDYANALGLDPASIKLPE
ncbi:ABC transporter substrate-binding protein [Aerococcaceae bacterium DSM 111176]|nr:ABC transporter substrate-binding protein [Aerococcaceae bacterium DSM 111176]